MKPTATGRLSLAASWLILLLAFAGPIAAAKEPLTWARDVAPILHRHCAGCHQDGGPAPFALAGYDDARSRARLIAEVAASGYMPPWLPEPGPPFDGERRLAPAEVAKLERWAAAGAPAGDLAAAPAPPPPTPGWRLGEPDLVIEMPEPFVLPAAGDDVFRSFVLPVRSVGGGGGRDGSRTQPAKATGGSSAARRWVSAVEIVPGDPRVVHHATLMVDRTDSSRRLDALDAAPGFDGMRAFSRARAPDGHLLGWTPGKVPKSAPQGLAWELAAGTDLVLELHLLPSGREEAVRPRVGLHFAADRPARRPLALRLGPKTLDIAAGESAYEIEERFRLPAAVDLLAVYPHAHYLCRSMLATAVLPDGRVETLLEIRAWDFDRQDQYSYREPIRLEAGTELRMRYVYDNSAANPRNPHQPPRRVVYGPGSGDEMGDLWMQVVPADPADFDGLARALDRREGEANVAGWRAAVARSPENATLRYNLGSELVLAGALDDGVAELERAVALDPALGPAHTNLGNAYVALAQARDGAGAREDLERAARHFERAVAAAGGDAGGVSTGASAGASAAASIAGPETGSTDASDALFNLANTLAALGRFDQAHRAYDRALELRPRFVEARLNQATAYARQGRRSEAIDELERCLEEDPAYVAALFNLALLRGEERGGLAGVLDSVARALAVAPDSAQIRMLRGDLLLRLERFEEAVAAYRAVIAVEPRSADAWANLARALARLGRRDEAEQAVSEALAIDGASAAALEVVRELGR